MIKKILFTFLFSVTSFFVLAQCEPDTTLAVPNFYPPAGSYELITPMDTFTAFPDVPQGSYYEEALGFVVWTDTTIEVAAFPFPVLANIDSVLLVSVSGFPSGLTFSCNPPSCVFPGGEAACANVFGTTTDPLGIYPIVFTIDVYGNALGVYDVFPATIDNFAIVVGDSTVSLVEASTLSNLSNTSNFPNPFISDTEITFNMLEEKEVAFFVFDMIGNKVFHDYINATMGENTYIYKHLSKKGIYMYQLNDGQKTITKRLIVK